MTTAESTTRYFTIEELIAQYLETCPADAESPSLRDLATTGYEETSLGWAWVGCVVGQEGARESGL